MRGRYDGPPLASFRRGPTYRAVRGLRRDWKNILENFRKVLRFLRAGEVLARSRVGCDAKRRRWGATSSEALEVEERPALIARGAGAGAARPPRRTDDSRRTYPDMERPRSRPLRRRGGGRLQRLRQKSFIKVLEVPDLPGVGGVLAKFWSRPDLLETSKSSRKRFGDLRGSAKVL